MTEIFSGPCKCCGEVNYSTNYCKGPEKILIDELGYCFTCAFWEHRAREASSPSASPCIIDGYTYGPGNRTSGSFRGMAGRRFDIEYFDGRRITTFDLWGGGLIPEKFKDRLSDNARFLGAKRSEVGGTICWDPSDPKAPCYPLPNGNCVPDKVMVDDWADWKLTTEQRNAKGKVSQDDKRD